MASVVSTDGLAYDLESLLAIGDGVPHILLRWLLVSDL